MSIPLRHPLRAILGVTLAVAAADMALAMGYWALQGRAPLRILQGIAAAVLGREAAIAGGLATAALGLAMHLALAFLMVQGAVLVAGVRPWLVRHPFPFGLGWGVFTWGVMMGVVVPLSAIGGQTSTDPVWRGLHLASHLFIVGVPSALLARRLVASPA